MLNKNKTRKRLLGMSIEEIYSLVNNIDEKYKISNIKLRDILSLLLTIVRLKLKLENYSFSSDFKFLQSHNVENIKKDEEKIYLKDFDKIKYFLYNYKYVWNGQPYWNTDEVIVSDIIDHVYLIYYQSFH